MKIALITDTHWGVRNDNVAFLDNNKTFLDNLFFPTLVERNIKNVIHLGDLVDRRKYININTAKRLREDFLQPLDALNVDTYLIAGNHDTYYKNTNGINSLRELIRGYDDTTWHVYDQLPREVEFDDTIVLLVPWICDENRNICLNKIATTNAQIVMGHFEIAGFEMYKGSIVSHGDQRDMFNRFDMVLSGHFHHRSSDGTIYYLGSHGEFTWSDYDDPKGFHIFDTETRELEFIRNPYTMFGKVWYDDSDKSLQEITNQDFTQYKNKLLKVIVTNKTNPYWFDTFIEHIENSGSLDIQIVEDHLNLHQEEDIDIVNEAESTVTIFKKFISQIESPNLNKDKLESTIMELYNEALTIE